MRHGGRRVLLAALVLGGALACGGPPPPNVVLVTLDTTRADHLGLHGYFRDTSPRLDAFAREALVYERALAPMATTLPAHTSLLTGRAPLEHGVLANLAHGGRRFAPAPGLRSLAELCHDAGYRTGAFVSAAPLERGSGLEAGFEEYHQPGPGFPQRRGEFTTNAALRWLAGVGDEPFFLWVHYFDAHWPFDPPEPWAGLFRSGPELDAWLAARSVPNAAVRSGSGPEDTRTVANAYDGELRYQDAQLGRLLDALAARPDWEHTSVVVVGDHGEGLAQHGVAEHGGTWGEQLHVPLAMRIPGAAPRRVAGPFPTVAALPTLARALGAPALAALAAQSPPPAEGAAVVSQDSGRRLGREGYRFALESGRWKLLRTERADGSHALTLFDLARDPFELANVATAHPAVARALAEQLETLVAAQRAAGDALRGDAPETARDVDPELARRLEALGYVDEGD